MSLRSLHTDIDPMICDLQFRFVSVQQTFTPFTDLTTCGRVPSVV